MGQVSVGELLADPDFVDPVVLIHRSPSVDNFGQLKLADTGFPTYGSVQPASGRTLQRMPEALRVADSMSFWIKGKIISDGQCQYPDVISFRGQRYAVQLVFDWTSWGDGWCEGLCVREKPSL